MTHTSSPTPGGRRLNVLLVEDNLQDTQACLNELKQAGFDPQCDVVQSPHELCSRLAAHAYDVVLAGHTMPAWTGLDVIDLLHQMERDIPVILLMEPTPTVAASECLAKGAADFIHKDRLSRLGLAVQRALDLRQFRSSRDQAERRLARYERAFRRLTELSPDPLFIQAGENLLFVNEPGVKLVGADRPEQLLGKPLLSWVPGSYQSHWQSQFASHGNEEEPVYFESKLARLDEKIVDIKVAATPITYLERAAWQLCIHDISERKLVKDTIRSLAAFAQFNPNPVLEFSREGKLTYFNAAALGMAKTVGREHPSAVLPPETMALVRRCLLGQTKLSLETSMGGRTLFWSFFPIEQNQVVHCYVSDITDRLNLEEQLRHSQKLESVGRLAAGVAHDFNNILTVIQGHTGLLRADPNLRPETDESVQQVSRAAERAGKLTSQLLAFSRRSVLQPTHLDLNEVLTHISNLLSRTLGEDINFQFNYQKDLRPILADPGMIEQVVMNLAVNARDAMPQGGQLVLTTSVVEVDPDYVQRHPDSRPGEFVCLTMTDTGCGMDHVTMGRLFEPFFTTKEFGKGTGLGLATVYGIIRQHQGWIEVQSQPGQGSTFKVFLPPASARAETPSRPVRGATATDAGPETILVVEDEAPVRQTARNILERFGYRVIEAANGVEALAIWHQHHNHVSLLLTDMVMPVGLSGQELAEKFTAQKPELKVIYTSGYSVESAGKGLSLMEGLHFLQKPFDADKLARAVRDCLDNS